MKNNMFRTLKAEEIEVRVQSVKNGKEVASQCCFSTAFPVNCMNCRYIVESFHSILHFPAHIFLLTL